MGDGGHEVKFFRAFQVDSRSCFFWMPIQSGMADNVGLSS
jgi:hypothetical protein